MTSHPLIRPEIASLPDYNAGLALDQFRNVYGLDAVAKLDSNESPLGPSPAAVQAIRDAAAGVGRYPDASDEALRQAIGAANGVAPGTVILGSAPASACMNSGRKGVARWWTRCPSRPTGGFRWMR